jgi:AAA domain
MALKTVNLSNPLAKIEYAVPDLFPLGYISFIGAREGVGKTTTLTGLAWQMTRPAGEFLGVKVKPGIVIFVNTDAPDGESRPVRFWLEKHRATFPDGNLEKIIVIEPSESGLTPDDMKDLEKLAIEHSAALIIIDSFMGAFGGLDPNRLEQQMRPLGSLRDLASRTGAALIVTDHLPKRAPGEREGDRGLLGSVAKTAQARAVHLLTRLEPKDCEGRNVIRWMVQKQSFSHKLEPFGVEVILEGDDQDPNRAVRLTRCDLPGEATGTGQYRAKRAVMDFLEATAGQWFRRARLLEVAVTGGNVKERMAADALREAFGAFGDRLEHRPDPEHEGKGAVPKQFRVKPITPDTEPSDAENDSMQSVPLDALHDCMNKENASVTAIEFMQPPIASIKPTARKDRAKTKTVMLEAEL